MVEIYLKNDKESLEESYDVIEINGVDKVSFTDDKEVMILFSEDDEDSVVFNEIGRFRTQNMIGYAIS